MGLYLGAITDGADYHGVASGLVSHCFKNPPIGWVSEHGQAAYINVLHPCLLSKNTLASMLSIGYAP